MVKIKRKKLEIKRGILSVFKGTIANITITKNGVIRISK